MARMRKNESFVTVSNTSHLRKGDGIFIHNQGPFIITSIRNGTQITIRPHGWWDDVRMFCSMAWAAARAVFHWGESR